MIIQKGKRFLIKSKTGREDLKKDFNNLNLASIGFINKILVKGSGHPQLKELIDDLNGDRVSDVGELIDLILYINDTSSLYDMLLESMKPETFVE